MFSFHLNQVSFLRRDLADSLAYFHFGSEQKASVRKTWMTISIYVTSFSHVDTFMMLISDEFQVGFPGVVSTHEPMGLARTSPSQPGRIINNPSCTLLNIRFLLRTFTPLSGKISFSQNLLFLLLRLNTKYSIA